MKEIMIKDYIGSDTAVSYDDGKRCQKDIAECLDKGEKVILNFLGISYVITAFLNPVIGDLILERGNGVMKFIGIKNMNETVIQKIKRVRDGALIKREDLEEWFFRYMCVDWTFGSPHACETTWNYTGKGSVIFTRKNDTR